MPDSFSILTFLGSIKTAKETLKLILDAPRTLEKTELEYKIASLTKTLTELENQARNFEKIIQEKDTKINELENLLKSNNKVERGKFGFYYKKGVVTIMSLYVLSAGSLNKSYTVLVF